MDFLGHVEEQTKTQRLNNAQALVTNAIAQLPEGYEGLEERLQEVQGDLLDVLQYENEQARKTGSVTFEEAPAAEDIYKEEN